jgi:hypothetical protein
MTFLLLLLFVSLSRSAANPFVNGSFSVTSTAFFGVPFGASPFFNTLLFAPVDAGVVPVVVFVTGLDGIAPNWGYTDVHERLAAHGVAVASLDREALPNPTAESLFLANWTAWFTQNVPALAAGHFGNTSLDLSRMLLSGHSAGGRLVVQSIVDDKFKSSASIYSGVVLLDPVDGFDPFGIINNTIVHPPKMLNFTVPSLLLASRLAAVQNGLFPPCASLELGPDRFFRAFPGPVWLVNATAYGHVDFCDQWLIDLVGDTDFCVVSTAPKAKYRDFVAGMFMVAVQVFLNRDAAFLSFLTDPRLVPVLVTMQHKA